MLKLYICYTEKILPILYMIYNEQLKIRVIVADSQDIAMLKDMGCKGLPALLNNTVFYNGYDAIMETIKSIIEVKRLRLKTPDGVGYEGDRQSHKNVRAESSNKSVGNGNELHDEMMRRLIDGGDEDDDKTGTEDVTRRITEFSRKREHRKGYISSSKRSDDDLDADSEPTTGRARPSVAATTNRQTVDPDPSRSHGRGRPTVDDEPPVSLANFRKKYMPSQNESGCSNSTSVEEAKHLRNLIDNIGDPDEDDDLMSKYRDDILSSETL